MIDMKNERDKTPILVVAGPTASGKTALAVALAQRYNGEVVSADSMQIYKKMSIGTAKPTTDEMGGIPHHLIDFVEPNCSFSVADYVSLAHSTIADITKRGKLAIVAGGTGLYISSLVNDVQFGEDKHDPIVRARLYTLASELGAEGLHMRLKQVDEKSAAQIHPNNIPRVVRALEEYEQTGDTMANRQIESRLIPTRYNACKIGISYNDRQILYDRINRRVDVMVERGLLSEAREIYDSSYASTAVQAIGYKELFGYFSGEVTLQAALDSLKQSSRRYAKRQLTWFRRDAEFEWFYADDVSNSNGMMSRKNICNHVDKFINLCYD